LGHSAEAIETKRESCTRLMTWKACTWAGYRTITSSNTARTH
jgi:hypothetical protein